MTLFGWGEKKDLGFEAGQKTAGAMMRDSWGKFGRSDNHHYLIKAPDRSGRKFVWYFLDDTDLRSFERASSSTYPQTLIRDSDPGRAVASNVSAYRRPEQQVVVLLDTTTGEVSVYGTKRNPRTARRNARKGLSAAAHFYSETGGPAHRELVRQRQEEEKEKLEGSQRDALRRAFRGFEKSMREESDRVKPKRRKISAKKNPKVWEETIFLNGKHHDTLYFSEENFEMFVRDLEGEAADKWKSGRGSASTSYIDGAGNRWNLDFRLKEDPRRRR